MLVFQQVHVMLLHWAAMNLQAAMMLLQKTTIMLQGAAMMLQGSLDTQSAAQPPAPLDKARSGNVVIIFTNYSINIHHVHVDLYAQETICTNSF